LAYLLDPVVRLLTKRTRLSRRWGAILVFLIFILLLVGIPAALGTVIVQQFERIRAELVQVWEVLLLWFANPIVLLGFRLYPQLLLDNLQQAAGSLLSVLPEGSFNLITDVTSNLLWGFVIFLGLFYFLKDGPAIVAWLVGFTPAAYQADVQRLVDELNDVWSVFLRIQLLIFVVLAILMGSGTFLVIWLFRTGLLAFSPLGFILLLIVVYTAAQQVDNLWLRPQLMGQQLQLHPGLVFAGLFGGLLVGGFLGALLIVPLMATVKVIGGYIYCQLQDLPPWPGDDPTEPETNSDGNLKVNGLV
jgi:predicted PurR-regulated permease PerM